MSFMPEERLRYDLESHVLTRTFWRVRNLTVELLGERIVLRGQAPSWYVKQLAQQGVRELAPNVLLENTIVVDEPMECCRVVA